MSTHSVPAHPATGIRRYRRPHDLIQTDCGALHGVSGQAVSKWERGVSHTQRYYTENARLQSVK